MAGHGHDRAGAVAHEHIVRHPYGDGLAGHRVHGLDAADGNARLFLGELGALKVALPGSGVAIGGDFFKVFDLVLVRLDQRVFGGEHHVGCAKERVRPGGVDPEGFAGGELEVHLRALAAANPVALLQLDLFDEVHIVQAVQQFLGVGSDLQHPLALDLADDLAAAAFARAAHDFLVGKAHLAAGTPVDGHLALVGEAVLKELEEDELRPLVVGGVGGIDLSGIVKGEAQPLQLLAEVVHVLLRDDRGVDVVFDRKILRRQAEGVVADGEEHVIAFHAPLPGDDVHCGIRARVPHMQAGARRVGELDQRIKLGFIMAGLSRERVRGLPMRLPLGLYGRWIVGRKLFHKMPPKMIAFPLRGEEGE